MNFNSFLFFFAQNLLIYNNSAMQICLAAPIRRNPTRKKIKRNRCLHSQHLSENESLVSYYQKYVENTNRAHADSVANKTCLRAFTVRLEKNIGYFLISSLLSELNVRETIDILASQKRFQFDLYDMIAQLIYARILYPCSKSKTASTVFPYLYHGVPISEDQIYDGCAFIGES